jgi:DNA-binding beta-propeller fold protein YncE
MKRIAAVVPISILVSVPGPGPAAADVLAVVSNGENAVTLVDPADLSPVARFPTGEGPHEIAISPDQRFAYVADAGAGPTGPSGRTVTVIDLARREVKATYDLGAGSKPHDLVVNRDGSILWVACAPERAVHEIDTDDGSLVKKWKTGADGGWMVAAAPSAAKIYVPHLEGGGLSIIDRERGRVSFIRTRPGEMGIAVSPDGAEVWVANVETSRITVIDGRTDRVKARLASGGEAPTRVRFTPDGRRVLVAHRASKSLVIFDRFRRAPVQTIRLPAEPKILTVSGDGRSAYMTSPGRALAMVVDLRSARVTSTFPTGKTPDGIAWAGKPGPFAGRVAFTINEPDLVPEGIAHDPVTRTFFVSSTYRRKILAVGPDGQPRDFTAEAQDGLLGVVGMKVDAERRLLWAASGDAGRNMPMTGMKPAGEGSSALHAYDLRSGKLARKFVLARGREKHFLNDLVIDRRGNVYITDSLAGAIYLVRPGGERLERFVAPGRLAWPNGIAISDDQRTLFVTTGRGYRAIDIATRRVRDVPAAVPVARADGIAYHRGSLVAVQGWEQGRVVQRYVLSPAGDRIVRSQVVVPDHPDHSQPTTGIVVDGEFFYIANSQLQLFRSIFRDDGTYPLLPLRPVVVLRVGL